VATPISAQTPQADELRVGELLDGTYELVAPIASGGMGSVYEARDRRLNRTVAIKVAHQASGSERLVLEAQALAALDHPGLVTVLAMGQRDGQPYVVMERLRGMPLSSHIERRRATQPFSPAEAVELLLQLADTLAVIHRAGIVHRDLKPDNVILTPQGRAVLLDFGVFATDADAVASKLVFGTPAYVAPESATVRVQPGQAHLVDLYALGALGFELLAGRPPYVAAEVTAMLIKHVHDPVPDLLALRADLPVDLAALVTELLAKEPTDRPFSAEAVGIRLRALRARLGARPARQQLSILIADDDPDMVALLRVCVEHAAPGASVRSASDGSIALDRLAKHPADLLLLDLDMPKTSGLEVCMMLRGTHAGAHTAIVAVCGHASERDRALLEQLGVLRVFDKRSPALLDDLGAFVRGLSTAHERTTYE
jgi:serine/threonine-protein kinase